MEFPGDGFAISFLRAWPLKRDTYAKLPDGAEKGNIAEAIKTAVWIEYRLQRLVRGRTGFSRKWACGGGGGVYFPR